MPRAGQPLAEREDGREQIAVAARPARARRSPRTRARRRGACAPRVSTSAQRTGVDTVGRGRARSEYTQTVVLFAVVLAPVDEHLAAAQALLHPLDHEVRVGALEQARHRVRERLRRRRSSPATLSGHVDLQALRARRSSGTPRARAGRADAAGGARPRSRSRRPRAGRGRGRRRARSARRCRRARASGGVQLEVGDARRPTRA